MSLRESELRPSRNPSAWSVGSAALFIATAVVCFVVGFLIGDARGVREANRILDANQRELFKAIADDRPVQVDDDAEPLRPVLH